MEWELKPEMVEHLPLGHYTGLVRSGTPFAFSRWGDGEWKALTGNRADANCDGHRYFPAMGDDLANVLRSRPAYYLGMQPFALRNFAHRVNPFLRDNDLTGLKWVNADVLHNAVAAADPWPWLEFLDALRSRPLVVVGPPHLQEPLKKTLRYRHFVPVPRKNCYDALEDVLACCAGLLAELEPAVVSLSCSMPAEIVLDRLHARFGDRHAILDTGSVWDPYAGVLSRKYMQALAERGWCPPA